MRVVFTHHAKLRMADRGITEEMVVKTLAEPDETGRGYQSRELAYRIFPPGRVKVVYGVEDKDTVVISAMWS